MIPVIVEFVDLNLAFEIAMIYLLYDLTYLLGTNPVNLGYKVMSGVRAFAGAARRRVHFATIFLRPPTSVWPSARQTPGPSCPYPSDKPPPDATTKHGGPAPRIPTSLDPMGRNLSRASRHMTVEA